MAPSRLETIRDMYDARAPIYEDDGKDGSSDFHKAQAKDYLEWMSLSSGMKVLDLACGTGGITIPAARAVGPSGSVIGVDISPVSLEIARSKAHKENLSVTFLEHDIGNLTGLDRIKEGSFDVITCASAMVFLEDPAASVKHWATLLKAGGKLIFDTSTNDSLVVGRCFDVVKQELNLFSVYGSKTAMGTVPKVKQMLMDAGLDPSDTFVSRQYNEFKTVEEVDAAKGGDLFEDTMGRDGWVKRWYEELKKPGVREKAKDIFCQELNKMADENGIVKSHFRFNVAVGRNA
ncbi:S-adenosyl-L-methionine-dependent methyltransferase [Cadophora sp. MPI-SDFR-AT-0126]|nr:S-adenosyl-L-methionine-dependent methyltransferase [Leotiomycetes sp. MPI-SDFR-AT-0126]